MTLNFLATTSIRIRTESSYQYSLESSRHSSSCIDQEGLIQCQSVCVDDDRIFSQIFHNFVAQNNYIKGKDPNIRNLSKEKNIVNDYRQIQNQRQNLFINSKSQLVIKSYDIHPHLQKQKLNGSTQFKKGFTIPKSIQCLLKSYQRCRIIPKNQFQNSVYGAIFGFIIGDSIGSHLIHKQKCVQNYIKNALQMKGGGIFNLSPGQGTDQTQLLLSVCDGLLQGKGKYNPNKMARQYFEWIQSKPFDYPTLVALSLSQIRKLYRQNSLDLQKIHINLTNDSIKNKNHQSSISLIKVIPLVIWSLKFSEQDFQKLIRYEMKLLVPNQFATECCIVYGKILRVTIKERDYELAIYKASQWIYNNASQKLLQFWKDCHQFRTIKPTTQNMGSVRVPLSFLLQEIVINKDISFVSSLANILAKGYNTDTNCSIVLGIIGAIVGFESIPAYYRNIIKDCDVQNSKRIRPSRYSPKRTQQIILNLLKKSPQRLIIQEHTSKHKQVRFI